MPLLHFNKRMEKQCFKCKETKSLSEFYRHPAMGDGYLGKCKTCTKRDVAEREGRLRNNPLWLARERRRSRIKSAKARAEGIKMQSSPATKQKWAMNNPHKRKAQYIAANARRSGKLIKPKQCSTCEKEHHDLEMHHPDYNKPLDVVWLCTECHGKTRRLSQDEDCDIIP